MFVSALLARESKGLLMGEGVDAETTRRLLSMTEADPAVLKAMRMATIYLGPEEITLVQDVAFRPDLKTTEINEAIVRIHQSISRVFPAIKHAYTQPVAVNEP